MLDRINVSYSQKGCKGNPQSYIKICKYSFSRSGVLLFRKAPLIHFYSYSVFFFFPEIPAITIINQKNGCLQFINVKLSASSASTAARCARSHQITFLPSPVHQKSSRNQSIRKPDIKKLEWISLTWNTSNSTLCIFFSKYTGCCFCVRPAANVSNRCKSGIRLVVGRI